MPRSKPPSDGQDDLLEGQPGAGATSPDDQPVVAPVAPLTPAAQGTPSERALAAENRRLARELGRVNARVAADEEARAAAEARRQSDLMEQLAAEASEDELARFNRLAELSSSDPMAALRMFRELAVAQSGTPAAPETPPAPPAAPEGGQVTTPPPPSAGVDASVPMGQRTTGQDLDGIVKDLQSVFSGTAEKNLDPAQRNHVTDRHRGDAMMAYLGAAYLQNPRMRALIESGALHNR